jgi:hypothetical protein
MLSCFVVDKCGMIAHGDEGERASHCGFYETILSLPDSLQDFLFRILY